MEQLSLDPDKFNGIGDGFRDKVLEFNDHFTVFGANLGKTPTLSPDTWNSESIILMLIPFIAGLAQLLYTVYSQIYQKKHNPTMQNMYERNALPYAGTFGMVRFPSPCRSRLLLDMVVCILTCYYCGTEFLFQR